MNQIPIASDTRFAVFHSTVFGLKWDFSRVLRLLGAIGWGALGTVSAEQLLDFTYTDSGAGITITDYPDTAVGAVEIPAEIAGKPVTAIGPQAFAGCAGITSVSIPSGVTSIGDQAFFNCGELVSVPLPAAVTSLGMQTFAYCGNLTSITIPAGVTSIGNNLFAGCTKLASVTLHPGITSIGTSAFESCRALTSLTLPTTLTTLGNTAFIYCSGLTGMVLPEGVTSIGTSCFAECTNLATVSLPSTLTTLGAYAFTKCASLTSLVIPAGVSVLPDYLFESCGALSSVTIPSSVTGIGRYVFRYCSSLQGITIPAAVTSIGTEAFRACSSLNAIGVEAGSSSFRSVGGVLFNQSLTSLIAYPAGLSGPYVIPIGVGSIGGAAFRSCGKLTEVRIPSSVTSIGNSAFSGCGSLTAATFAGNAPATFGTSVFNLAAEGFVIRYYPGPTGFTSPTWRTYPAVEIGYDTPIASWLASQGLPIDSSVDSDENGDGVSLLMAYALNLNPNQNLAGSLPQPVFSSDQLSFSFHAGAQGVTYSVETSTNLVDWTTEGVSLSAPDENQIRTATANRSGSARFMRLVVSD